MRKKLINISVFVLMLLFCACGFVSFSSNSVEIFAAAESQKCYTLIQRDAINNSVSTYESDTIAGNMNGTGYYQVGQTANLHVLASDGYYVTGFKVTYLDQTDKTEYVWLEKNIETSHTLSYADSTSSTMLLTKEQGAPTNSLERAVEVNVQISQVGENLNVTPIFDHLYSRIKIDNTQGILATGESVTVDGVTLYYSASSVVDGVTTFENAYTENENVRYYYGEVCMEGETLYTLHKKLDANATEEKIPLALGAFRQNETANLTLAVNDFYDVLGIQALREAESNSEAHTINKTNEGNTKEIVFEDFSMEFNTALYVDLQLDIQAHRLHKVMLEFLVDGATLAEKHYADFFGEINVRSSRVSANVSSSNYFTAFENIEVAGKNYPTQYFIKSATNNSGKAFNIQGVEKILKVQDGVEYNYYLFSDLEVNGVTQDANTISFNDPTNSEIEIKVNYSAVKYNINFEYREKQDNVLIDMAGEEIQSIALSRGEEVVLGTSAGSINVAENIEIFGYSYKGLSLNRTDATGTADDLTVVINESKPTDITVYVVFEKIEYTIVLTGINTIDLRGVYAINQLEFNISGNKETFTNDGLQSQYTITNKIKITQSLAISATLNTGFIVTFNLKQDGSMPIEGIDFDEDEIALTQSNTLYIYASETFKTYTLTYVLEAKQDDNVAKKVIMANIDAITEDAISQEVQILKEENANEHKITVTGLYYGDKIKLTSEGITQTETAESYTYIFNKFYKGQVTNTLTRGEAYYVHTQADLEEIVHVVYGLPRVSLAISWDTLLQEDFNYSVSGDAGELEPNEDNLNEYIVGVGEIVTVTVSNIKFGYSLTNYNFNSSVNNANVVANRIEVQIEPNYNELYLIFSLNSYRFDFKQYGEAYYGENYSFDGLSYTLLTVEDRLAVISLPTGMYVSKVAVDSKELESVFAGCNFKQNNSTTDTVFRLELTVEQAEHLINTYSTRDANGMYVAIELTYELHKYSLSFKFVVSGGSPELNATIPSPTLTVVDGANNAILSNNNAGSHVQEFLEIKHGTSVSLVVGNDLKHGLIFNSWNLIGDVNQISSNELAINSMTTDVVAEYVVVYVPYTIKLYNYAGNGNPIVNGVNYTGNQTIKMFDSLNLNPAAERGIKIKAIRNIEIYSYNASTWLTDYQSLYYRANGEILPATEEYDATKSYFREEKILELNSEAGNLVFNDDEFKAENYFISTITSGQQTLQCVCFDLEYELIPYTIKHSVKGLDEDWLAMFGGTAIYSFEINGGELDFTQTYTKNESLGYVFKISNQASIGNVTYNLVNDVLLKTLKINNQSVALPTNNEGDYTIVLNVGNYIPDAGDEISVEYVLKITKKNVTATTQIQEDPNGNFKSNIEFYISNEGGAPQPSSEKLSATRDFDYLTNLTEIRAQFNSALREAFEFGEVQIYLGTNKTPFNASECEAMGITIERNNAKAVTNVKYRLGQDIKCVFIVRPKIDGFQSGEKFTREFKCDSFGNGVAQPLTVGEGQDIDISNLFDISVVYKNSYGVIEPNPTNVGLYDLSISFNGEGWMAQIGEIGTATLEITKKVITAMYDPSALKQTKEYDGKSSYTMSQAEINNIMFDFKSFADGANSKISYAVVNNWGSNKIILGSTLSAFSTTGGENGKTANANENLYYNLYVQGLTINSANITLSSTEFEISSYLQIQKRKVSIVNVNVQNKVFDNTTNAKVKPLDGKPIDVVNEIVGEQLIINTGLLQINFTDKEIGANKKVIVSNIKNSLTAISGDTNNYKIEDSIEVETNAGIYPDRITKKVEGVGNVSIINLRGLNSEDDNIITLLPINSRIEVEIIYQDSPEYRNSYRIFGKNVRGNNEFAIGYTLKLISNETVQEISKDLYVQVPNVKHLTGAYYLTGDSTGKINYSLTGEGILIDLNNLSVDLDKLMFTQQRILLKVWQIILILVLLILVIVAIILIIVIIRRKKKKDYSVHEKI